MSTTTPEEIYVPLLDEGVDVWRPARAERLADGSFRLLPVAGYDPDDEKWEFPPGSVVVAERKTLSGGDVLAAVRLAGAGAERRTA